MNLLDAGYLFAEANIRAVRDILKCRPLGIGVDVDGTISELASTPGGAMVSPRCQRALRSLVRSLELVAVVSGRPVAEARSMVGVKGAIYVGNHGLERWEGGALVVHQVAARRQEDIRRSMAALAGRLAIDGLMFEDKGLNGAIHYRNVADPDAARNAIIAAIESLETASELKITEGKKVIELRPPVSIDKGVSVKQLIERYSLAGLIYLGDDLTDVDAFRALRELRQSQNVKTLSVAVLGAETPDEVLANVDLFVNGVTETAQFLEWLVEEVGSR